MTETTSTAAKQWYIVHTYSGFEERVKENLQQRIDALGMREKFGEIKIPTETQLQARRTRAHHRWSVHQLHRRGRRGQSRSQHAESHGDDLRTIDTGRARFSAGDEIRRDGGDRRTEKMNEEFRMKDFE